MRKICIKCRMFVKGNECPNCHGNKFSESWQGRIFVLDANKSEIAKNMNIAVKGEYAIKVK